MTTLSRWSTPFGWLMTAGVIYLLVSVFWHSAAEPSPYTPVSYICGSSLYLTKAYDVQETD